jgi:DNA-binding HxlR family transcriptional regulator
MMQPVAETGPVMQTEHRSECPINLTLEILGDRWSLLILRDMIFSGKRHFRDLLRSQEGIASNILADRLKRLVAQGLLTRAEDPSHKQKAIYSLTPMAIELVPVFAHIGAWGRKHLPASEPLSIRAELLEKGGPAMWNRFMRELRAEHLGESADTRRASRRPSVREILRAGYEKVSGQRTDTAVPESAMTARRARRATR